MSDSRGTNNETYQTAEILREIRKNPCNDFIPTFSKGAVSSVPAKVGVSYASELKLPVILYIKKENAYKC